MGKRMLINTVAGRECRIAIVADNGLEELYVERSATASHVGNIYKARVTNVESAIQAAFVDTGLERNGFLHISDLNPTYFPKGKKAPEKVGRKQPHYVRPPIQDCLRRGQEVVVQMTKEGIGTKGPTMTTYLSIPGRLLVMMPGMSRLGVSRKVEDDDVRRKARAALSELNPPEDIGFIVRTAGVNRAKRDLQRDLNYLLRLWKAVEKRIKTARAPVELYRESDLVTRTIRDIYNTDIERIICDAAPVARRVEEFLRVAMPRSKHIIEVYTGKEGLFHDSGVEDEIVRIHSRRVPLPGGGSLVIDQTEALVAIDVNSGRFRQHTNAETTALKTDLQAAPEIIRQLRLRDLGGVIVIDFIDLREDRNRRAVEHAVRDALKHDRAKTKLLRMSAFGIVELTRQRLGPSLEQSVFGRCPHCDGTGLIKSEESLSLQVMRSLQRACANENIARIEVTVAPSVAHHLGNSQRQPIAKLEAETGKIIVLRADNDLGAGDVRIACTNTRGAPVAWERPLSDSKHPRSLQTVNIQDLPPAPPREPGKTPEDANEPAGALRALTADEPVLDAAQEDPPKKKSRRGRRGGRKHRRRRETAETETAKDKPAGDKPAGDKPAGDKPAEAPTRDDAHGEQASRREGDATDKAKDEQKPRRKSRRSRRRTPRKDGGEPDKRPPETPTKPTATEPSATEPTAAKPAATEPADAEPTPAGPAEPTPDEPTKKPKTTRRRSRRKRATKKADAPTETGPQDKPAPEQAGPKTPSAEAPPDEKDKPPAKKKTSRRRRRSKKAPPAETDPNTPATA